ncbi:MAG: VWA domain-containing protein [Burkholderiales bacterium]|nr:VWA domain-containing protein [Burkholderiales bacterium]
MRFLWRDALWLLLAIPILIGAYQYLVGRAGAREALRCTDLNLVRAAAGASRSLRRFVPPLLFLLGITGLLVAAARPAAVFLVPAQRGTVVLAMDVSYSMAATDVAPTRLAAAQAAAARFVENLPAGIRVGIIAFGGYADIVLAPTPDKARILSALWQLELQQYTALGTGLLAALLMIHPAAAVDPKYDLYRHAVDVAAPRPAISRDPPPRPDSRAYAAAAPTDPSTLIILVSDGKGTLGVPPAKAAELVAAYGIRVYTIGVGTPYGGTAHVEGHAPVHAEFEEETLELIAAITRAKYSRASDRGNLKAIYEDLSRGSIRERKEFEVSAVLAGLAGALLILGATLSRAWHGHAGGMAR